MVRSSRKVCLGNAHLAQAPAAVVSPGLIKFGKVILCPFGRRFGILAVTSLLLLIPGQARPQPQGIFALSFPNAPLIGKSSLVLPSRGAVWYRRPKVITIGWELELRRSYAPNFVREALECPGICDANSPLRHKIPPTSAPCDSGTSVPPLPDLISSTINIRSLIPS